MESGKSIDIRRIFAPDRSIDRFDLTENQVLDALFAHLSPCLDPLTLTI